MIKLGLRNFLAKIRSRARQGKAFENMIRASLKRLADNPNNHFWFQRLWDYRSFIHLNPKFCAIKQPADFIATCNGKFYLIECKSSQANRFDPFNVRPHQIDAMKNVYNAGSIYWLLILKRGASPSEHTIFAFDLKTWSKLLLNKDSNYKTASWQDVAKHAAITLQRQQGTWNLKPLFGLE